MIIDIVGVGYLRFDSVDHIVLLRRLQSSYGIRSTVLDWFTSYLEQRVQYVRFRGRSPTPSTLLCGVPQGSVLGPILFTARCYA